jgi:transposase
MAKYSFELKKQIVLEYLSGVGGSEFLAKKYGIPHGKMVRNWIKNYNELGEDGLRRSREKKNYSFEFKLHVVQLYLSSEVSYQELAISQGINNYSMIVKWVNDFRIAGTDALRPKKKGRKKSLDSKIMEKSTAHTLDKTTVDTSTEHVKQLEDELLKLRIENAYLKELRRLRLEEEALLRKQRESSTVSEESSN